MFSSVLGIPMTKKKFAELELSLLHLQQNVEIPETHLIIHPVIQRTVEQVKPPLFSFWLYPFFFVQKKLFVVVVF